MNMNITQPMTALQQTIQQSLPVIPNNGNPAGPYNMPGHGTMAAQQQPPPSTHDRFPWLKPSPFMQSLAQSLQQKSMMLQQQLAESVQMPLEQPVQPQEMVPQQQPAQIPQQALQAPVAPQGAPVLPMRMGG